MCLFIFTVFFFFNLGFLISKNIYNQDIIMQKHNFAEISFFRTFSQIFNYGTDRW
ncbi:hypothetical protein [Plasmodium yoelii yoelii]|uniref:Uncharacterized protein n=1 Tax=Plasmodium yoelii yoelii TaxID=73239 RepID=Q7RQ96_PLAYO|nr:hypothetical protein [Plasmodium yoelii yoelii]